MFIGKVKADSLVHFQELLSVLACVDNYITVEPYIDAKCDVHVQKIGNNYKAFMRKSVSGGWKSNIGSAVLEQIPVTESYKKWADEVSKLFNGVDLVAIEILINNNNEQFIYEVTGSQFTLMGETQEEDRKLISDLITIKMQQALTSQMGQQSKRSSITQLNDNEPNSPLPQQDSQSTPRQSSGATGFLQRMGSISGSIGSTLTSVTSNTTVQNKFGSSTSIEQSGNQTTSIVSDTVDKTAQQIRGLFRRASQTTNDDGTTQIPLNTGANATGEDTEDTMKNLRKTFAGIFGDN